MIETFFLTVKKGKYMRSTVLPGIFLASILILSSVLPGYAAEGKPEVVVSAAKSLKERGLDGKDKVPAELDGKGIKSKANFNARDARGIEKKDIRRGVAPIEDPPDNATQRLTIKTKSSPPRLPSPGTGSGDSKEVSGLDSETERVNTSEIAKLISKLKDELRSNPKALGLLNALEAQIKTLLDSVSERGGLSDHLPSGPADKAKNGLGSIPIVGGLLAAKNAQECKAKDGTWKDNKCVGLKTINTSKSNTYKSKSDTTDNQTKIAVTDPGADGDKPIKK